MMAFLMSSLLGMLAESPEPQTPGVFEAIGAAFQVAPTSPAQGSPRPAEDPKAGGRTPDSSQRLQDQYQLRQAVSGDLEGFRGGGLGLILLIAVVVVVVVVLIILL